MKPKTKHRAAALRALMPLALTLLTLVGANRSARAQTATPTPTPPWVQNGTNISNTNGGNVGVGTASPGALLDVRGSIALNGSVPAPHAATNYSALWLKNNVAVISEVASGYSVITLGANYQRSGGIWTNVDSTLPAWTFSMGAGPGYDQFSLSRSSTGTYSPSPLFMINSSGNVGIGTANPASSLHLNVPGGAAPIGAMSIDVGSFSTSSNAANSYFFRVRDLGAAGWTPFYIRGDGNVGIGTTSPSFKMDVQGGKVNASDGLCIAGICKSDWSQVGPVSQWSATTGTTGIYYGAGNIGVGTASPSTKFSVTTTNANDGIKLNGSSNWAMLGTNFGNGSYNNITKAGDRGIVYGGASVGNSGGGFVIAPWTSATSGIRLDPLGNLGVAGDINATGAITGATINATYQDVAEWVPSTQNLHAGTVVVLDTALNNHVIASSSPYDTRVAGVVSSQPGLILGQEGDGKLKVATTGRVKVRVNATRAPIEVGDLLVTSDVDGVAMKSIPLDLGGALLHRPGTIIGKALEPLACGKGEILVLLSLQ